MGDDWATAGVKGARHLVAFIASAVLQMNNVPGEKRLARR